MMMRNQHRARVGTTHDAGFGFDSFALFFLSNHSGISGISAVLAFWILAAALDRDPTTPSPSGCSWIIHCCHRLSAPSWEYRIKKKHTGSRKAHITLPSNTQRPMPNTQQVHGGRAFSDFN